jgi:hypothetical protein
MTMTQQILLDQEVSKEEVVLATPSTTFGIKPATFLRYLNPRRFCELGQLKTNFLSLLLSRIKEALKGS